MAGRSAAHGNVPLPAQGEATMPRTSAQPGPETVILLHDQKRTLDRGLHSRPEDERTALMWREGEAFENAQIAAVTNVPIGTVMSRSRAGPRAKWLEAEEPSRAVR